MSKHKEYCQLVPGEYVSDFAKIRSMNNPNIGKQYGWRVWLGTEEIPYGLEGLKAFCEEHEINFDELMNTSETILNNEDDYRLNGNYYYNYRVKFSRERERPNKIKKINYLEYSTDLDPTPCLHRQDKYMTDKNGTELFFSNKLDAINYLSKNGGWYLDQIVPESWTDGYGGRINSVYLLARDVEE